MKVEIVDFDDLPKSVNNQELSNNGHGREYASYLLVWNEDSLLYCKSDAMDSGDATFTRDLSWIPEVLERVYRLGQIDTLCKSWGSQML